MTPVSKIQQLAIDLIRTDGGTQMRAELTQEVYIDYRDKWLAGVVFDPVDVFHDGATYWLADGFHRFYGAREAKRASLPCTVHQGTQREAILFACGANARHGLRRLPADKRISVTTLLNDSEWCNLSNGVVAETCHVTPQYVGDIRRQLETVSSSPAAQTANEPKLGKDGKRRKPSKPRKKKPKPPKPADVKPPLHETESPQTEAGQCIRTGGDHLWGPDVDNVGKQCCLECGEPEGAPKKITGGTAFNVEEFIACDAFGKAVPDELGEIFDQRPKWEQAMTAVSTAKKFVTELKDNGAAVWLDVDETNRLLGQARTNLKFAMPHTECPKCKRKPKKDCPHCKGLGWLTQNVFNSCASDPDKSWLEART